uniref:Reverse transcriptase domain-containing protein n=1 Tax=Leptobrachium leishanense TaxID=445787 RepID=A0A8C5QKS0_9ANUR
MAKMMAMRLSPFLPSLIHPDQVGFTHQRGARDNTYRAVNLIHRAHTARTPMVLLSVDAEKAFDRVDWTFMKAVLERFGLGPRWLTWISALYNNPSAVLRINGVLSTPIGISNGTRQGCPLSPLLFIMTLEPLLQRIRDNDDIRGVTLPFHQYKVSAFADDIFLTLLDPVRSTEAFLKEVETYSGVSNFKINTDKCEMMGVGISLLTKKELQRLAPFSWPDRAIQYLGIQLPSDLTSLFDLNYVPLINRITRDLKEWRKPQFSWFGRINILKMTVLPKFLYLFQTIPITIPSSIFSSLKTIFLKFIWGDNRPRIAYDVLVRPKSGGGLGLPHLELYYDAALLTRLSDWSMSPPHKLWVHLEQLFITVPIVSAPWQTVPLETLVPIPHPTIHSTLKRWRKHRTLLGLSPLPSLLTPITHNPDFLPGRAHSFLGLDWDGPYVPLQACVGPGGLISLMDLLGDQLPTPLRQYNYLQLQHFINTQILKTGVTIPTTLTTFETICTSDPPPPHLLSYIYSLLLSARFKALPSYTIKWSSELPRPLTPEEWSTAFQVTFHSSRALTVQETNYKLLSRWYLTPTRLHAIYPDVSPDCWRCQGHRGTFLHIWWDCPIIRSFWEVVWTYIKEVTDLDLPFHPMVALLHVIPLSVDKYVKSVAVHLLNAARALIPRYWKQTSPPTIFDWIDRVEYVRELEELHYTLEQDFDTYFRTWYWWTEFSSKHKRTTRKALTPTLS